MGYHYGTTGMWYKDGIFYELQDTHVNFFLNNFDKLGFTKYEKEKMCVENDLPPDAVDMCRKYQQESVYFKEDGKPPVWLNEKGQVVSKRSSDKIWKNDASKPFFTSLKDESAVDKELREKLKHFYKIQIQKENRPYNEDEFEEFYQKNKGNRDIVKNLGRRYTADIESAYDVFMSCGINFINRQALGFQSRYRQACRGEIGIRPDDN